jgi:gluconokinase
MGVSGSGKTTVGQHLAVRLGAQFLDADDFHPASNVEKMRNGVPLTDADRAPWLASLAETLKETPSFVLACSALKAAYREVLQEAAPDMRIVLLDGTPQLIRERLGARAGHFMSPTLLESQFATLEIPEGAIRLDIDAPVETIVARIYNQL